VCWKRENERDGWHECATAQGWERGKGEVSVGRWLVRVVGERWIGEWRVGEVSGCGEWCCRDLSKERGGRGKRNKGGCDV
jgi:hypothetical protein